MNMRGLWLSRLRLSRGWKTIRNLVLCALLLVCIWGLMGYPLPTAKLELRRWERQNLLEAGEVIFSIKENGSLEGLAEGYSVEFPRPVIVSVTEDRAVIGAKFLSRWGFAVFPLEKEPFVTPIPTIMQLPVFSPEGPIICTPVLAFGLPKEAAGGEITLMGSRGTAEVPLTGPGWEVSPGLWLFAASTRQDVYSLSGDAPYTMKLWKEDGSLLLEKGGSLGEM